MRLKHCFLIIPLFIFYAYYPLYCQDVSPCDSLFHELEQGADDTTLFIKLCECINDNLYNDPGRSMKEARFVLEKAMDHSYDRVVPKMIMYQGICYDLSGKYDSAIIMYDSALVIAKRQNLKVAQGDIYNNYSIVYSIMGQLELSIDYCLRSLDVFEETGDSASMAKVYNNLGSRYSELGMDNNAIEYYQKAIAINEQLDNKGRLVKNYGNIGTIYSALGENEKALEYYTKAYMIQKDLDNKLDMSITLSNMAIVYRKMGKYDLALSFAEQSYLLAVETHDEFGKMIYYSTTGDVYGEQGNYKKALNNLLIAESLADSMGAEQNLIGIYRSLSDIYAGMGDYLNAYHYNEKYNDKKLGLLDEEKARALDKIQKFQEEKKQVEIDLLTKDAEIRDLVIKRQKIIQISVAGVGFLILLLTILLYSRYRYVRKTKNQLAEKNIIIQGEKEKSDNLLLNILPAETAEELKTKGNSQARSYEMVTVMFTDFKGFTQMAETMDPEVLVSEIDHCFKAFDNIISRFGIEKIKTIGDAYMCAGGLPVPNTTNPVDIVKAALEIRDFMKGLKKSRQSSGQPYFEVRIGVHTGPVIAGIVGIKKFQYDIWGDTVNIASRMETSGEVNEVNISGTTYNLVKEKFECVPRGKIEAKNKGAIEMYFVKGEIA